MTESRYVLKLSCVDRKGIVSAVAGFLADHDCNILDSAQYGDSDNGRFFMRVSFTSARDTFTAELQKAFEAIQEEFAMQAEFFDAAVRSRVIIMVSRFGHCLNDLLYRYRIDALPIEIPAIVSNHRDFYQLAASHDIPFYYLPMSPDTKVREEARLLDLFLEERADLLVLARYMQVLSPQLCGRLKERVINIHHSFLPSFQGAKPYQQAHDRGVKLIGATAHYVTEDLDEGPIIEQDVARVEHGDNVKRCTEAGRDVESAVLARAVGWHVQHRILLNGHRTVVFR